MDTMMMINIEWDFDGEEEIDETLPSEVEIPVEMWDEDYDEIVDWVSDQYGWCIKSCDIAMPLREMR